MNLLFLFLLLLPRYLLNKYFYDFLNFLFFSTFRRMTRGSCPLDGVII